MQSDLGSNGVRLVYDDGGSLEDSGIYLFEFWLSSEFKNIKHCVVEADASRNILQDMSLYVSVDKTRQALLESQLIVARKINDTSGPIQQDTTFDKFVRECVLCIRRLTSEV